MIVCLIVRVETMCVCGSFVLVRCVSMVVALFFVIAIHLRYRVDEDSSIAIKLTYLLTETDLAGAAAIAVQRAAFGG